MCKVDILNSVFGEIRCSVHRSQTHRFLTPWIVDLISFSNLSKMPRETSLVLSREVFLLHKIGLLGSQLTEDHGQKIISSLLSCFFILSWSTPFGHSDINSIGYKFVIIYFPTIGHLKINLLGARSLYAWPLIYFTFLSLPSESRAPWESDHSSLSSISYSSLTIFSLPFIYHFSPSFETLSFPYNCLDWLHRHLWTHYFMKYIVP